MKFKLLGTEIYISFLFSALIAFMIATDRTGLCIPTLFAAFIHETGHLLALWACDCQPKAIRLIPASVQIVRGFSKKRHGEAAISLCGPMANLVVFLALFINYSITKSEESLRFGLLNMILCVFNLLPVPPLDGSRILAAFLPGRMIFAYYRYQNYIMLGLFALLFLGVLDTPLAWLRSIMWDGLGRIADLPFKAFGVF